MLPAEEDEVSTIKVTRPCLPLQLRAAPGLTPKCLSWFLKQEIARLETDFAHMKQARYVMLQGLNC